MKTITKNLGWLLLSCFLLVSFAVNAQFTHFPTYNAPIHGKAPVAHGLLNNLDKNIWFKVNGNIAGPQPHNKMMNHAATPAINYVSAGAKVEVNFNVNKNTANRYTLVSYTVQANGKRLIYDYQSNFYNANMPVQGNSNQQQVLVPTCQYEIYFIKGAPVIEFMGTPYTNVGGYVYDPMADPNNPFANDLDNVIPGTSQDMRIIEYAYGGSGYCDDCPVVLLPNPDYECVFPRLLEVVNLPGGNKELIFSVINTVNTNNNNCGTDWPEIGDILFTNITPAHTGNNQPYSFRYNYQLGPKIANYPLPPTFPAQPVTPPAPPYQGAFIFDQRNNHNILDFDVYQSEIVRFTMTGTEFAMLSQVGYSGPKPQICIELSNKNPQPHQTQAPVYCFDIDFICAPVCPPPTATITGPDELCYFGDEDYFFTTNAVAGAIYNWTVTNGSIVGDQTSNTIQVVADDELGPGQVSVTVTDQCGTASDTYNFVVIECEPIEPLPVELIDFTGRTSSSGIVLNWKTASEKNNDRFEVERSLDGRNFEKIGTVKGNGTSSATHSYSFTDKAAKSGINYYRLNQVDFDGSNERSKIIKVTAEKAIALGIQLIPNPCSDQNCSIVLQGADASKVLTVEMRDLTGRLIFSQNVPGDQGSFNLPKAGLGKGIYILSARNGLNYTYQKVIIQ